MYKEITIYLDFKADFFLLNDNSWFKQTKYKGLTKGRSDVDFLTTFQPPYTLESSNTYLMYALTNQRVLFNIWVFTSTNSVNVMYMYDITGKNYQIVKICSMSLSMQV